MTRGSMILEGMNSKTRYTTRNSWQKLETNSSEIPIARVRHSAVIWDDNMYIFGGLYEPDTYLSDFWSFDLNLLIWTELTSTE